MRVRSITAGVVVALAVSLAGCTVPAPSPTSTPTGFADDAAAFAAAEATYRAYVDAQNQVDLGDPASAEPVFAFTTGEANADDRKSFSQMHRDGWTKTGSTKIDWIQFGAVDANQGTITVVACIDVSAVDLRDRNGVSVVSADRPTHYAQSLTFRNSTPTSISDSVAIKEPACA